MKITLDQGHHVTATEKKTILACIKFQSDCAESGMPCPEYLGKKRSNKSYKVESIGRGQYSVTILTRETSDFGRKQTRKNKITIIAT